jgi:hypothetical protein
MSVVVAPQPLAFAGNISGESMAGEMGTATAFPFSVAVAC